MYYFLCFFFHLFFCVRFCFVIASLVASVVQCFFALVLRFFLRFLKLLLVFIFLLFSHHNCLCFFFSLFFHVFFFLCCPVAVESREAAMFPVDLDREVAMEVKKKHPVSPPELEMAGVKCVHDSLRSTNTMKRYNSGSLHSSRSRSRSKSSKLEFHKRCFQTWLWNPRFPLKFCPSGDYSICNKKSGHDGSGKTPHLHHSP